MSILKTIVNDKDFIKQQESQKQLQDQIAKLQAQINESNQTFVVEIKKKFNDKDLQKELEWYKQEKAMIKERHQKESLTLKLKQKQESHLLKDKQKQEIEHLEIFEGALGMKAKAVTTTKSKNYILAKSNVLVFYQKGIDQAFELQLNESHKASGIYSDCKKILLENNVSKTTANSTAYHLNQSYMANEIAKV